jgi:hypothetical protein
MISSALRSIPNSEFATVFHSEFRIPHSAFATALIPQSEIRNPQ